MVAGVEISENACAGCGRSAELVAIALVLSKMRESGIVVGTPVNQNDEIGHYGNQRKRRCRKASETGDPGLQ